MGSSGSAQKPQNAVTPEKMEIARSGVLCAAHAARYAWIQEMKAYWPIRTMCQVIDVSDSVFFSWQRRRNQTPIAGCAGRFSDECVLTNIRTIHAEVKEEYGWPRMHKELGRREIQVGKERVRVLMKRHDIRARTKRKFVVTTDSKHKLPIAPNLINRQFSPQAPNQL